MGNRHEKMNVPPKFELSSALRNLGLNPPPKRKSFLPWIMEATSSASTIVSSTRVEICAPPPLKELSSTRRAGELVTLVVFWRSSL